MPDPKMMRGPDGNYVYFEWDTEKNEEASTRLGRPMFDKVLRVYVISPGSPKSIPTHVVGRQRPDEELKLVEFHNRRYAEQIKAFLSDETGGDLAGTPLENLPFLDLSTRASLRAQHIYTAEALADLPENGIANVGMGAREWKKQAAAFIEAANGGAPMVRLVAENERLSDENKRMAETIKQLAMRMDELEKAPPKRGPGRPPKSEAA